MKNWLALLAETASRIPFERLVVKPPNKRKQLEELRDILGESKATSAETPEVSKSTEEGPLEPRREKVHIAPREAGLSTEDTVTYQNREIGKLLLRMERHYAQKLRINGVPCDCGSQKHLLDLESLCEETIPMVDNSAVYYRIIEWSKEVAPKSTDQAAKSGQYDDAYPSFSHQARDFRKDLMGSLEPSALFTGKLQDLPGSRFAPEKEEVKDGSPV